MATGTGLDAQIGYVAETTWGTAVTVTRFHPLISETLKAEQDMVESAATFAGFQTLASQQWALGNKKVSGDIQHELYDQDEERTEHTTFDDFAGVVHVVTLGVWCLYAAARLTHLANPELAKAALFWALAIGLVTGARGLARGLCRRHPAYLQNTLIIGAGTGGAVVQCAASVAAAVEMAAVPAAARPAS